jgi:hypothetical protein
MVPTIFFTVLLDGHIGQMNKHIIHLGDIRRVQFVTKPAETLIVNVSLDGTITRAETYVKKALQYRRRSNFLPPMRRGLST